MTERSEYIAGLRALADLLDSTDLELPTHGRLDWLLFNGEDNPKERAAAIVRAVGGKWNKKDGSDLFWFEGKLHGLPLHVTVDRETVCTRVVTGTREVETSVPVTFEIVTQTVEDVEWICQPLLAEVSG